MSNRTSSLLLPGLKPNLMKPIESEDGHTYYTVDGIVPQQGPNYALAKRMQHWMVSNGVTVWSVALVGVVLCSNCGCCIVLFFFLFSLLFSQAIVQRAESHTVCTNVAPSTATISVTSNKLFEMAYGGMHNFKPMEVMWPCTSNALMGAVLLHDMNNEKVRMVFLMFWPNGRNGLLGFVDVLELVDVLERVDLLVD